MSFGVATSSRLSLTKSEESESLRSHPLSSPPELGETKSCSLEEFNPVNRERENFWVHLLSHILPEIMQEHNLFCEFLGSPSERGPLEPFED